MSSFWLCTLVSCFPNISLHRMVKSLKYKTSLKSERWFEGTRRCVIPFPLFNQEEKSIKSCWWCIASAPDHDPEELIVVNNDKPSVDLWVIVSLIWRLSFINRKEWVWYWPVSPTHLKPVLYYSVTLGRRLRIVRTGIWRCCLPLPEFALDLCTCGSRNSIKAFIHFGIFEYWVKMRSHLFE